MSVLENAYDLIQKGQLEEAKRLLDLHRTDFESNADYWWLVAHAATDPETGRSALGRVLVLDKDYPGARELDDNARAAEQLTSQPTAGRSRRLSPVLMGVLLVAIVAIVLLLVISLMSSSPTPAVADNPTVAATDLIPTTEATMDSFVTDPTAEATEALPEPTQTVISVLATSTPEALPSETAAEDLPTATTEVVNQPTLQSVSTQVAATTAVATTASATQPVESVATIASQAADNITPVPVTYEFMQGQQMPDEGVVLAGETLKIALCALPGIGAGNAIHDLLLTISTGTKELDTSTSIVEIAIVDCENNDEEQRVVSVPRAQIDAFAAGSITLQQLQQAIQPVR